MHVIERYYRWRKIRELRRSIQDDAHLIADLQHKLDRSEAASDSPFSQLGVAIENTGRGLAIAAAKRRLNEARAELTELAGGRHRRTSEDISLPELARQERGQRVAMNSEQPPTTEEPPHPPPNNRKEVIDG